MQFSTRQTALLLGIAEATVKRLLRDNVLTGTRSKRGWSFAAESVQLYLRTARGQRALEMSLEQAVMGGNDDQCVAAMIALRMGGVPLGALFDRIVPIAGRGASHFIERAQPLAEQTTRAERPRPTPTAVVLEPETIESRMAASLLRATEHRVLVLSAAIAVDELPAVFTRAGVALAWIGRAKVPDAVLEKIRPLECTVISMQTTRGCGALVARSFEEFERMLVASPPA